MRVLQVVGVGVCVQEIKVCGLRRRAGEREKYTSWKMIDSRELKKKTFVCACGCGWV